MGYNIYRKFNMHKPVCKQRIPRYKGRRGQTKHTKGEVYHAILDHVARHGQQPRMEDLKRLLGVNDQTLRKLYMELCDEGVLRDGVYQDAGGRMRATPRKARVNRRSGSKRYGKQHG